MLEFLRENEGSLFALLGVLIGALLSPYVTNRIESAKMKRSLQPQLIKLVYKFFAHRREIIMYTNVIQYQKRSLSILWGRLGRLDGGDPQRIETERQFNEMSKLVDRDLEISGSIIDKLNEIESLLIATLCEVKHYYGKKHYKKLHELIQPEIDKSNQTSLLRDYDNLTEEEHTALSRTIQDTIKEHTKTYHKTSNETITTIMSVLD